MTFLFSDIEGSTWLVQHLGDAFDDVLETHRTLLRAAWSGNGGHEMGTEGDSFFVAFADPADAIRAAAQAQSALGLYDWPDGSAIRVRMGIHTGEARVRGNDYTGLAVHQAARIAAAAHGGQTIISEGTTATLTALPDGVDVADLGLHRLKDLAHPVRLYQLTHADLPGDFPPPRTLTAMPNNFPIQQTEFVGRENDVAELGEALARGRVLTLTGAGGVGKTRLALQVAAESISDFPDGAWLVDLAPLAEPELVASQTARVLGVREQPGRPITDTIADNLASKQLLVVLDNCEHLIDACAKLTHQLISTCPKVKVLATSREALSIHGEVAWRVRSLSMPGGATTDLGEASECEAVQLFVERAQGVRPEFTLTEDNVAAVTQICRRLDGLPLAIELAAARARSMAIQEIADRLDDRFRLLTGGSRMALPRQRTLEAAVSWSYELLPELDKLLFDRMSVFAGGCTQAAVEHACTNSEYEAAAVMDVLYRLVERSLLSADWSTGETRYHSLETIRQFGREKLIGRGEVEAVRTRHLAWAVAIAATLPQQIGGGQSAQAAAEGDNFRVALEWAADTGNADAALRIAGVVWIGNFDERWRLYDRLLPPSPEVAPDVAGKALFAGGGLAFMMADWALGAERLHAAVEANTAAGDRFLVALSLAYEGNCVWGLGDTEQARRLMEAGLDEARAIPSAAAVARALVAKAWLEVERDLDAAEIAAREGLALSQDLADPFELGHFQEILGFVFCMRGDYARGAASLADAAATFHRIQHNCASHILETAAAWAAMTGRFSLGGELWGAAERIRDETRDKPRPWERAIQEVWLPAISDALSSDELESALANGRQLDVDAALDFAEQVLRESADHST